MRPTVLALCALGFLGCAELATATDGGADAPLDRVCHAASDCAAGEACAFEPGCASPVGHCARDRGNTGGIPPVVYCGCDGATHSDPTVPLRPYREPGACRDGGAAADAVSVDVARSDAVDDPSADLDAVGDEPPATPDAAPPRCPAVAEPPAPVGACDGMGRMACTEWARLANDGGLAYATCVAPTGTCARADRCADPLEPSTCRCGVDPACGLGEVCAPATAGSPPSCRCVGGTATDGGRACPPDRVSGCGMCASIPVRFHWDGRRCVLVDFQCHCLGADCTRGTLTWRACQEAHAACLADPDTRIRRASAPQCGEGTEAAPLPSAASAPVVVDLGPDDDPSTCTYATLYACNRCHGPCP